jgi:NAD-dependent SIR2 family protein deacetylase
MGRITLTEEDVENIETLLSLADLSKLVKTPRLADLLEPDSPTQLRRFVDAVISKSIALPGPGSPQWIGLTHLAPGPAYRSLVNVLAYRPDAVTVITLNYDPVLEYACWCMGLPFSYGSGYGQGVEILKLHGSSSWLLCENPGCPRRHDLRIAPVDHVGADDAGSGYLRAQAADCEACGGRLTPLIVPPTWLKEFEHPVLTAAWTRAVDALHDAEVYIAIGCSLAPGDAHVRQLLHLGFSSGRLRQALIAVGPDPGAEERWSGLVRRSWARTRLDTHQETLETVAWDVLGKALVMPESARRADRSVLLPITRSPHLNADEVRRLRELMAKHGVEPDRLSDGLGGVDWTDIARGLRGGAPAGAPSIETYRAVLREARFDWTPGGSVLPAHGERFAAPPELGVEHASPPT